MSDINDINKYADFLISIYDYASEKIFGKSFSSCSLYNECSNKLTCVNKNPELSSQCHYKKNLKKGLCFYGKNAIFNDDGSFNQDKINKNKELYKDDVKYISN